MLVFESYQGGELVERIEERGLVGTTSLEGVEGVLCSAGSCMGRPRDGG